MTLTSKLTKITSIGSIENSYLVICDTKDREIIEVDSFWTCTKYCSAFSKRGMARDGHCWGKRCWKCKNSEYRAKGRGGGIPIRNFCDHKLEFLREVSRLKLKNEN